MSSYRYRLIGILAAVLLTACSSSALRWTPDYHTVKSGETLYAIAHNYGLDYRDLASWNRLGDGSRILAGPHRMCNPATCNDDDGRP